MIVKSHFRFISSQLVLSNEKPHKLSNSSSSLSEVPAVEIQLGVIIKPSINEGDSNYPPSNFSQIADVLILNFQGQTVGISVFCNYSKMHKH